MKNTSLITCLIAAALIPAIAQAKPTKGGIKKIDTNGDGVITYAEVEASGAERFLENFSNIDSDGSGDLTREEMRAFRDNKRQAAKDKVQSADSDGNGAISYDEASNAGFDRLVKHFDKLDSNGDGEVTREEMNAARKSRKEAKSEDS